MTRAALISVSDKTGVTDFAKALADLGYKILSTGGTAKALATAGIEVVEVADYTRFPEMMEGRVKTLHPKVHGGILYRRDSHEHVQALESMDGWSIDVVCVNLYPFEEVSARSDDFAELIENIDIGGPSMIRSAAKNHAFVTVVVGPEDYEAVILALRSEDESAIQEQRRQLALKAFYRTSRYDEAIFAKLVGLDWDRGRPRPHDASGTDALTPKQLKSKGHHSRGYLHNFDAGNVYQFITFRLGDSLPADVVSAWKKELAFNESSQSDSEAARALREKVEAYEDAGHGECHLSNPKIAKVIQNSLLHGDGTKYRLVSWCIMPNHVHVLIRTFEGHPLPEVVKNWKSFTAHEANKILDRKGSFWSPDYFDRFVRNEGHYSDVIHYIRQNPVKAGLVSRAEDWQWGDVFFNHADGDVRDPEVSADEDVRGPKVDADETSAVPAVNLPYKKLRYGENPHQIGYLLRDTGPGTAGTLAHAEFLSGKELSYNNYLDSDAALRLVREFERPTATIIKHLTPCGVATRETLSEAYAVALSCDPVSAYGGIVAVNREIDLQTAEAMSEKGSFLEVVIAPSYSNDAVHALTTRRPWGKNVRLLCTGNREQGTGNGSSSMQIRSIDGGRLMQSVDAAVYADGSPEVVVGAAPSEEDARAIHFAWLCVKYVKSNAIVLAKDERLLASCGGQTSRVDAVKIALERAKDEAQGAVLASDAFFPFADSIELAASAGVKFVIQPGGSKRDDEVREACEKHGITMLFTGMRHFLH
ncbi:MAG: transposase [Planctomycetes bacterium]|nr:transposase [Planctomycetota bacterium]